MRDRHVVVGDRWFALPKTCSSGGEVRETINLAERTFTRRGGLVIDPDVNAAINLAR